MQAKERTLMEAPKTPSTTDVRNNLMELSEKRPHANGRATKKGVNVHEQKRGPFIALGCPRRFKSFVPLFVGPGVSAVAPHGSVDEG
jgi:hypothetical protein